MQQTFYCVVTGVDWSCRDTSWIPRHKSTNEWEGVDVLLFRIRGPLFSSGHKRTNCRKVCQFNTSHQHLQFTTVKIPTQVSLGKNNRIPEKCVGYQAQSTNRKENKQEKHSILCNCIKLISEDSVWNFRCGKQEVPPESSSSSAPHGNFTGNISWCSTDFHSQTHLPDHAIISFIDGSSFWWIWRVFQCEIQEEVSEYFSYLEAKLYSTPSASHKFWFIAYPA